MQELILYMVSIFDEQLLKFCLVSLYILLGFLTSMWFLGIALLGAKDYVYEGRGSWCVFLPKASYYPGPKEKAFHILLLAWAYGPLVLMAPMWICIVCPTLPLVFILSVVLLKGARCVVRTKKLLSKHIEDKEAHK